MPRGNAAQVKVHYAGKAEDFIIFVDDAQSVKKWKDDRSIPLAQVVSGFKIFVTHKYVPNPGATPINQVPCASPASLLPSPVSRSIFDGSDLGMNWSWGAQCADRGVLGCK